MRKTERSGAYHHTGSKVTFDPTGEPILRPAKEHPVRTLVGHLQGVVSADFVFEYKNYKQCHAGTIVEAGDGAVVAAWYGGTAEEDPDTVIYSSRYTRGRWNKPIVIADGMVLSDVDGVHERHAVWHPVLFRVPNGPIMLFYKVGPSTRLWTGMFKMSYDHGKSWSPAQKLPRNIVGPSKNKPVLMKQGTLLVSPSSDEKDDLHMKVHVEYTARTDTRWYRSAPLGSTGRSIAGVKNPGHVVASQPTLLVTGPTHLLLLARTRNGKIYSAHSRTSGHTWSPLTPTQLPNPDSAIDAVTLANGKHLLVYNHATTRDKGLTPLNVAVSNDGVKWFAALVLEDGPGDFSYPAVIQTKDGLVHILYSWHKQRMRHVVINPSRLLVKAFGPGGEWPS
eukprot:jgi/Mesvir1/10712/Mv13796-RA.1